MNQKLLYEQIITEKLDRLPVPDMADAIWAHIEGQLDLDMPTNDGSGDGGDSPAPQAPVGGGTILGSVALLAVVAALIVTYFVTRDKEENTFMPPNLSAPAAQEPSSGAVPDNTAPANGRTIPLNAPRQNSRSLTMPPPATDSGVTQTVMPVPLPLQDSTTKDISTSNTPASGMPQSSDTVAAKKKKGVPGLTDADYRIVPAKKDSTKN